MTNGGPISFVVPGTPVPWARARLNGAKHFKSAKVREYQKAVAYAAKTAFRGHLYAFMRGESLVVFVEAVLPVPPSWSKQKREDALRGLKRPTGRPDVDNYAKIVLDALNGIAWKDDSQVWQLTATKRYGPNPHLTVTVR